LLQRPKVGGGRQYLERTRRSFRAVRPQSTTRRSSETACRRLAVDTKLAVQRPNGRQRHAARQPIDGDGTIKSEQRRIVEEAYQFAEESPYPQEKEVITNVFA